jgi:hypothetical protein
MSFNRPLYDACEYETRLGDNEGILKYTLDSNKHYNCNQKRIDFGLLGGNNVSQSTENLVDLESDLRNQTRLYSKCPQRKYRPTCDVNACGNQSGYPCGDLKCQPKMYHMPEATLIDYKPRYKNKGYSLDNMGCPTKPNPTMFSYANNPAGFVNHRAVNNAFKYAL